MSIATGVLRSSVSTSRKEDESKQMIGIKVYQRFNYCLGGVGSDELPRDDERPRWSSLLHVSFCETKRYANETANTFASE